MSEVNHKLKFSLHSMATRRSIAVAVIGLIVLYGLIPNLNSLFGVDLHLKVPNNWTDLVLAFISFMSTFVLSSISYRLLAIRKIHQAQILLVQLGSSALNLLLPDGIGGISLNYLFLRNKGLTSGSSALAVGLNNSIGVAGNVSMLILLVSIFGTNHSLFGVFDKHQRSLVLIVLVAILVIMIILLFLSSAFSLAQKFRRNLALALKRYRTHWLRIVGSYGCSLGQATVTALAFWLSLKAFNIELAFPLAFLIYSLSVLVGGFFPTPGGLGGVEASLVAAVVAVHGANTSIALSAVLTYRLLSYWLPVGIGSVSLYGVHRLKLVLQE